MDVDLLHPLSTLKWEECPAGCEMRHVAEIHGAVWHQDRLYLTARSSSRQDKIHITSKDLASWTELSPPSKTRDFALATYCSKLVVLGGRGEGGMAIDQVWVSDGGGEWQQDSLPPMPTSRYSLLATSVGSAAEMLVAAGGRGDSHTALTVVEVLREEQWSIVQSALPMPPIHAALHHGNLYYLSSGQRGEQSLVYCTLASLQHSSKPPASGGSKPPASGDRLCSKPPASGDRLCSKPPASGDRLCSKFTASRHRLWRVLDISIQKTGLASFGGQLVATENHTWPVRRIHALHPPTQSWVCAGELPEHLSAVKLSISPVGELLVVGYDAATTCSYRVFRASLKSEYHFFKHL